MRGDMGVMRGDIGGLWGGYEGGGVMRGYGGL